MHEIPFKNSRTAAWERGGLQWVHWYSSFKQGRQCTCNVTLRRVRVTIVAVEKQYYIFWVHVLALVIQHAKCMCRIIFSSLACLALLYFSILSHQRHDFRQRSLLNIKWALIFSLQLSSEQFLIPRRILRDIINAHRSSCKVPVILDRF
jgi:hypothetical protein